MRYPKSRVLLSAVAASDLRRDVDPNTLVVVLDSSDVLCLPCGRDLRTEYLRLGHDIVFGTTCKPWPDVGTYDWYPTPPEKPASVRRCESKGQAHRNASRRSAHKQRCRSSTVAWARCAAGPVSKVGLCSSDDVAARHSSISRSQWSTGATLCTLYVLTDCIDCCHVSVDHVNPGQLGLTCLTRMIMCMLTHPSLSSALFLILLKLLVLESELHHTVFVGYQRASSCVTATCAAGS